MKKNILLLIGIVFLFSSCSIHNGLTKNLNNYTTEVVLAKNNFKVIDTTWGEAQAMYICGIGGLSRRALVAEARADMLLNAKILGSSRAVINETVEIRHTFFPFVRLFTVTVSGHIIEFTE